MNNKMNNKMDKWYTSSNGLVGHMIKDYFFGVPHWDFFIYENDKMVFHSTLSEPYTEEEFHEQVDNFPEFREFLCSLSRKDEE